MELCRMTAEDSIAEPAASTYHHPSRFEHATLSSVKKGALSSR